MATIDDNRVKVPMAVSNSNGITVLPLYADPLSHRLIVSTSSGTMPLVNNASRDQNRVPTLLGVDGSTTIPIGIDAITNGLFIKPI